MKKNARTIKNKSINEEPYLDAFYSRLHEDMVFDLVLQYIRISECVKTLQEYKYDHVPSQSDIYISLQNMADRMTGKLQEDTPSKDVLRNFMDIKLDNKSSLDIDTILRQSYTLDAIEKNLENSKNKILKDCNIINKDQAYDIIKKIIHFKDIHRREYLGLIGRACLLLAIIGDEQEYKKMSNDDKVRFVLFERSVRGRASEVLGIWTHGYVIRKKNKDGGGKTRHEDGEKNKEAIKEVLAELNIKDKDLNIFKKDKKLRAEFMAKAKDKTKSLDERHRTPLSEKTILDIARNLLKEQDTKPPV
jgi:hypothetical protein